MIGIIGALKIEIARVCACMSGVSTETISGIKFFRGIYRNKNVVVAQCGIGKVFAAYCAQTMILKYGVTKIINIGAVK